MSYICAIRCSVCALSLDTARYSFTADILKTPGSSTCVQYSVITDVKDTQCLLGLVGWRLLQDCMVS